MPDGRHCENKNSPCLRISLGYFNQILRATEYHSETYWIEKQQISMKNLVVYTMTCNQSQHHQSLRTTTTNITNMLLLVQQIKSNQVTKFI